MDQDILSEILSNYHPPLTGSLLSNLPPRQTHNGHDSAIQSLQPSTNVKLSNPNQAGAVISKIEDIFESIADCILDEKKEMTIRLKTRKRKGNQVHDAESGAIKSVSDEKERSVRFPSRSPQEAWKFGMPDRLSFSICEFLLMTEQLRYFESWSYLMRHWLPGL